MSDERNPLVSREERQEYHLYFIRINCNANHLSFYPAYEVPKCLFLTSCFSPELVFPPTYEQLRQNSDKVDDVCGYMC